MDSLVIIVLLLGLTLVSAGFALFMVMRMRQQLTDLPQRLQADQESRHRVMLTDLAEGLARQGDRIAASQLDAADRLRTVVSAELAATREAMQVLQNAQGEALGASRESMIQQLANLVLELGRKQEELKAALLGGTLERLAEQSRAQQETIQATMRDITLRIAGSIETLTKTNDTRLAEISGKVNERLEEGFRKTNETFVNVMARLATIDEAQKKIDGLTTNVVSLQQLLGDKRSRGAFGEVQLESIVRNVLPPNAYEFQFTLSNNKRADCVLKLPLPTGLVAIDSKFPLENYESMLEDGAARSALAAFKADVRKHIDDIAAKYIIAGETGEGAMLFLPAEAVFAEIHAHHRDLVEHAARKHVWIVSPTTMMAVLNTALAVIKDVETRKQVHVIKDQLGKLGADFGRFQSRMDDLAKHIGQAQKDVEQVHISSRKITEHFQRIEKVELESPLLTSPGGEEGNELLLSVPENAGSNTA